MERERRKQALLAGLTLVLAAALYYAWSTVGLSPAGGPSSAGPASRAAARRTSGSEAPSLHLNDLESERPEPVGSGRNLFRFESKPGAVAPVRSGPISAPPVSPGPSGPPPPPPISLKFIGTLERPERSERIAVLRDAAGRLMSGREGAIVDGRLRILRIGTESIDLAYLDGRGRQTIRLSGG
jgi:hypothetical protein